VAAADSLLGHELNNSLAPIKSIAGTLSSLGGALRPCEDINEDMQQGLQVIETESNPWRASCRPTRNCAHAAPTRRHIEIDALVHRTAPLERRLPVMVSKARRDCPTPIPTRSEQLRST